MYALCILFQVLQAAMLVLKSDSISISSRVNNSQICFEIHSAATGYFAFGIGDSMQNSDIYAIWRNSLSFESVFRLEGRGHRQPPARAVQDTLILKPSFIPEWANLSAQFCRDMNDSRYPINPETTYIYAWQDERPGGDIDSPNASMKFHDRNFGIFQFDFVQKAFDLPTNKKEKKETFLRMALYHALIMFVAWIPAPIAGVFVARYMKNRLTKSWYHIHLTVMGMITGIGTVVGFFLIYSVRTKHFQSNSLIGDVHYKLGLGIIVVMAAVQIPLGFLADYYYDPTRTSVPILDRSHRIVGMLLVVLSIFNIWLGIRISDMKQLSFTLPLQVLFYLFLLIGIGLFGFAEVYQKINYSIDEIEECEALVQLDEGEDSMLS